MSPRVDRFIVEKNVATAMRDGVSLRSDVWRPESGAVPAVVERTPYQKERAVGNDFLRSDVAATAGLAMVIQDTRGRFASEGTWSGFDWAQELLDTIDTLAWVADQPWCDGQVALRGVSYPGLITWLGMTSGSPHLRAAAPAMAVGARLEGTRPNGTVPLELILNWFVMQIAADVLPSQIADGTARSETIERVQQALRDPSVLTDHLPLRESPFLRLPGTPVTADDVLTADPIGFPEVEIADVSVPTLLTTGWFDASVDATFEAFASLRSAGGAAEVRSAHRLLVGPWTHALQLPATQGELVLGLHAVGRVEVQAAHLAFLAEHLRGERSDRPAIRYFLVGANTWCESEVWPPSDVQPTAWYLRSGGHANTANGDGWLSEEAPGSAEPPDRFRYDPRDPVRSHGGDVVPIGSTPAGPLNQQHLEARQDVLCYSSEPFTAPLDAIGPVRLRLEVATDARSTDFSARLLDVGPDGRSLLVTKGIVRLGESDPSVDRPIALDVNLGQIAWRFAPGHRLRIHVTSSDFPHHDRNMNTGNPLGVDRDGVVAEQTVYHDASRISVLRLHTRRP